MTPEIVVQIFRFGFLLLLWLFIFAAFRVVRADLFGGRAGRVASVPPRAAAGKKRPRGPKALVVTHGPLSGTKITLGEQWYVEDLGSTNGTYLDQQRVQGPLLVNPGMPIRIGQTAMELR